MAKYLYEIDVEDQGNHRELPSRILIQFFATKKAAQQFVADNLQEWAASRPNPVTATLGRVQPFPGQPGALALANYLANWHPTDQVVVYSIKDGQPVMGTWPIQAPADLPPPSRPQMPDPPPEW